MTPSGKCQVFLLLQILIEVFLFSLRANNHVFQLLKGTLSRTRYTISQFCCDTSCKPRNHNVTQRFCCKEHCTKYIYLFNFAIIIHAWQDHHNSIRFNFSLRLQQRCNAFFSHSTECNIPLATSLEYFC